MEYMLIYRQPAEVYEMNRDPVKGPPNLAAWQQYLDAMGAAGVIKSGNRLEALAGTSVKVVDGKRQVQDGPFAAPMARSNCSTFGRSNCSRQDGRIMRHRR